MVPLGLDPFKVRDGVLSIVASRIPSDLKEVLFGNEYVSGVLTTQISFSQKYGYFEIRARIPLGTGMWSAFWRLANEGGWPPEIDAMEGRGQRPGDVAMTTHWRIPATGSVESCDFDFSVPNAWTAFHDYGVLWEQDRLVYFVDRKPVSDIKVPASFEDKLARIASWVWLMRPRTRKAARGVSRALNACMMSSPQCEARSANCGLTLVIVPQSWICIATRASASMSAEFPDCPATFS
jgi:hypothetical protein